MRIVIFALSIIVALAASLAIRRARYAKLDRLAKIVRTGPDQQRTGDAGGLRGIERFIPALVLRHARILDIHAKPREAAAIAAAFVLVVGAIGVFVGVLGSVLFAVLVCITGVGTLHILTRRRINELSTMMPGFFDRVRQLLVIGNSLPTAFSRALQGSHPKLATFFGPALRRVANGAGFVDTIRLCSNDAGLYEMHLFSAAVSTNMRFGGSLTRSLSNLVQFLRKRASIERELRASTSMIRSSAWVLGILPVLVAALIVSQNQEYARWFVTDPTGKLLLGYCISSQLAGAFVMRAITRTGF